MNSPGVQVPDIERDADRLDAVVRAAATGNKHALNELLEALRPLVCRWALVWTGDPDDAEDTAQQVIMRVHSSIRQFEPRAKVTTWVYRITQNVLRDRQRKSRRENRKLARFGELAREAAHQDTPDDVRPMVLETLHAMMKDLSQMQRAAFDLVDLQGHTAVDAAEMLGVEAPTVRVHLLRARAKLRQRMGSVVEELQ